MNLIFDLDDTLYDLSEPFRRSHKELLTEQLGENCEELFRKSRVYSDEILALERAGKIAKEDTFYHRIYRTYQDAGLELERGIIDAFEEKYRYYQKHITVPEGIRQMLDFCKTSGHRMVIFSNGNVKNQGSKIAALSMEQWFEKENIIISEMTGFHKPSLEAFQYVEKHLHAKPEDIWYVGDTYEADVFGGKRAGWNVIWYNHRQREVPEHNLADITVNTAKELLEVLRKIVWGEEYMKLIVHDLTAEQAKQAGFSDLNENEYMIIDGRKIDRYCIGCFGCWLKTPGTCIIKDEFQHMGKNISKADELIIISKATFGSYSSYVKNVLDRSISYVMPFFKIRKGEMHHAERYNKELFVSAYFYGDDITETEKETSRNLVQANAVNLNGTIHSVRFIEKVEEFGEVL